MSVSPRILVVDDERTFPFGDHVRHVDDAIRELSTRDFDEVWLDHDLGPDEDVRDLARWLVEQAHLSPSFAGRVGLVYVHSMNPVGADWLVDTLSRYYTVRRVPLPQGVTSR